MGSIEPPLTEFQRLTESELVGRLDEKGIALADRRVQGTSEVFVSAKAKDVDIWIYIDGACVIGRGVDRVFEKWDYGSLGELRRGFVDLVLELLCCDAGGKDPR